MAATGSMFHLSADEVEIDQEQVEESAQDESRPTAFMDSSISYAEEDVAPEQSEPASRRSRWVDEHACGSLCSLILDDRHRPWDGIEAWTRRRPLPPSMYAEQIAPFLRFDSPLPNMLYAIGGRSHPDILSSVDMFDSWHGRWVACPPMPTARAGSAAAPLVGGRIIVVGGYDGLGIVEGLLASCDVYDPRQQRWEEDCAPSLQRARWGHGCAALGGRIYAVGGCSLQRDAQPQENFMETLRCCEVYDPCAEESACAWRPCAPLQVPRSGSRVVALEPSGSNEAPRYLAAVGGCDDIFGRAETQPSVELFDATVGHWFLMPQHLEQPRTTAAVVAVSSRQVLVIGGAPSLASAELFQISQPSEAAEDESPTCKPVADMLEGRMGCQAAVLSLPAKGAQYPLSSSRCVAIVGGERCVNGDDEWGRAKQFSSVPVYDLDLGAWREDVVIPPMPSERTAVALCVAPGMVTA